MKSREKADFLARVRGFVLEHRLLVPGCRVLAAVSGGPDSVALARALGALRHQAGFSFSWGLLHIDHQLRGAESDRDRVFCQSLAGSLKVTCVVRRTDVRQVQADSGGSLEDVARAERYRLFADAAREFGAGVVALGHQADDNVETILHRLFRGTGLRGVAGIPVRRRISDAPPVDVVRPFLHLRRAEILEYLSALGQEYIEDSSNRSLRHTRNWIRLSLIPELERHLGRAVSENLLRFAESADQAQRVIADVAQEAAERLVEFTGDRSASADVARLAVLPPGIRTGVIRRMAEYAGCPAQGLLSKHYRLINDLVRSAQGEVHLPAGLRARVDGGRLCFSVSWEAGQTWTAIDLPVPGDAELPDGRHLRAERLSGERLSLERIRQDAPGVVYLNWEAVRPPLRVRLPRPGDALEPLGMSGHQKLQDFFVNARVPRLQRRRVPLVEDQERILWVVGLRMAEPVKIVPGTAEILRLSLVGGRGMPPGCSAPSG